MRVAVLMRGLALACTLFATAVSVWPQAAPVGAPAATRPPTVQSVAASTRPRVALVLSGGGARGGAHIGVLKVLEEQRVPIDIIVGTSSGAIVGASYASGTPLAEIEKEMKTLSTATIFRDLSRDDVPLRRKADDAINYIGPEVGLGPGGLELPKGAVAGVALEAVLRRLTVRQRDSDFDKLPIRFRAIATDVATSEMVVLNHGSLSSVIRASMAIPAVVNPVEIDGRLLIDGGVVRNLPIDVARSLGAQVVIAVDIGTPLLERKEITSLLSVSDQLTRILTVNNVNQSLKELTEDDVLITPDLGTVATSDFDRLADAASAGENAARQMVERLARLQVDAETYAAISAARTATGGETDVHIREVRVEGLERVNEGVVRAAMETQPGSVFDAATADNDMRRIYGRGDFERVSYFLTELPGGGHAMTTDVGEKAWGPHYLRLGFGLSTDFEGTSFFNLLLTHRWTWLNHLGAEWRNDVQIGHNERLRTEWHQPLTSAQRWFVAGHAELARDPFDTFDDEGRREARFRRDIRQIGVDVGVPFGNVGEARLGLVRGRVRLGTDISATPGSSVVAPSNIGGAVLRLRLDALDSVRLPRAGYALDMRLFRSYLSLGADEDYSRLSIGAQAALSRGPHALQWAGFVSRAISDDLPFHELSSLGGFLQLSGYQTGEFTGRGARFSRLSYTYRIARPGFFEGMSVGVSAEVGRIGDEVRGPNAAETRHGNAVFLIVDTFLGPLYLAYGRASSSNQAVYMFLGQP
jgi:NTE family protein